MCIYIIILITIIIIILLIYCKCFNTCIKENYGNGNEIEPLLKRTTKSGNELIGKTINIKDGGLYKKLIENVGYDTITFETNATHNLFIYLGHVGGDNNNNYIRNPIYQNDLGMPVALNNKNGETPANMGFGNIGYEIALNEKLETLQRYHIRGPHDFFEPISATSSYTSTISDNALQKHIYSNDQTYSKNFNVYLDIDGTYTTRDCSPNCSDGMSYLNLGNKYINISENSNIKENQFFVGPISMNQEKKESNEILRLIGIAKTETEPAKMAIAEKAVNDAKARLNSRRQGKAQLLGQSKRNIYDNFNEDYKVTNGVSLNFQGKMDEHIINTLKNRNTSLSSIPVDLINNNKKIITSSEANVAFDKYGYIPLNFNHDPYILTKKPNKCELSCGNNMCIKLTVKIRLNENSYGAKTSVLKDDIVKLMKHIEDNKIGYDSSGLQYNINGCQYYTVPYGSDSLGANKAYPVYTEVINAIEIRPHSLNVPVDTKTFYTINSMEKYDNKTDVIKYTERSVGYTLLVPESGNAMDHYNYISLNNISQICVNKLNKWKVDNDINLDLNDVVITNRDQPLPNDNKLTPIIQKVDIKKPVTNIIKITLDRNNRIIKVYKCDSWDNNSKKGLNPTLILTHGLSTPNKHENQLLLYPEIWVGFKEDLTQDVLTLKNNKSKYHNFENKNNELVTNPDTKGIDITIKHIDYNYVGFDPDPSKMIDYKYSIGGCSHFGDVQYIYDLKNYPSYQENCKKKCDDDELCSGFTAFELPNRGDQQPNADDRINWQSIGSCKLHKANELISNKIVSSKILDTDNNNVYKKYLKNISNNELCFIAKNKTLDADAYFDKQNKKKIDEFKTKKYKPLRIYLNILDGTDNQEDYPTWMNCSILNGKVVCDNNTTNKFVDLIKNIRSKINKCNAHDLCRGGITSTNGNTIKIVNTLNDISLLTEFDGHNNKYGINIMDLRPRLQMSINTVYFVKESLVAYVVLFDHFDEEDVTYKHKYKYISEFEGPKLMKTNNYVKVFDRTDKTRYTMEMGPPIYVQTNFIIIELFEYLSCTNCTPSELSKVKQRYDNDVNNRKHVSLLKDKLNQNNIYTCETQEITTNAWDNHPNKPRFVQVYPSVRFKGLRLRIKGGSPVHIVIGNIYENDRNITESNKNVIPKSGSGIQISMDTFLQDGLGSYILKKSKNTLTYEMLSEFTSESNKEIKSNIRYVGGDDDFLPKIIMSSLDNTNINSVLGVSVHERYGKSGNQQDKYQYNKKNGVAGLYQSFVFDFDEYNNKLYVLYKSSVSSDYSLLMDVSVDFAEVLGNDYKLYIVSDIGTVNEKITHWQADLYKYEHLKSKPSGDYNCYNIISYEQNRQEISVPLIQEIPNYTARGAGKCLTTNNKIPPFRTIDLKHNPLTGDDIDLERDNDDNRLTAFNACSAFCSPEPNGVNNSNDCIGFELDRHTRGYLCQLYANKSHRELSSERVFNSDRLTYYNAGLHRITSAEECPSVCDPITKTYQPCEKEPNGCRDDGITSPKRCYSRDDANIITVQQLNEEKQLKISIEEQMRQESRDRINEFKNEFEAKIPEKKMCPENDYITQYNNCICPENKPVKYMPVYDNNGNRINKIKYLKCGTEDDIPQKCGIREFDLFKQQQQTPPVNNPTCVCPYGKIKVNDGGDYWCDLPRNDVVDWSDCIPDEDDPRKGIQFKSTEVSFIGQGDVLDCKSTNNGHKITVDEQSCTPNNLPLDYWIKAFRNAGKGDEKGCNSSWFTDTDDYVWDKYKNGIDYYNDNKNNNFDYQYLLNWSEARLNDGHGLCNNRWRGPNGACIATWEKTTATDDYYTCQTDSGQCILQTHNKKQTEMDKDLIDVVFDKSKTGKNKCETYCPIISHALNDPFSQSTLPDNAPISWHHGTCDNLWSGGKRNLYWVCEPDKGNGVYGVKPVLLTEDRANNDPTVKNYISKTKEDAIIECTPHPPEYEGPMIDLHDHISYISSINAHFDENELTRFPNGFANESNMKNWHDANPLEPHVELYGDKIEWFEELLRFKTRQSSTTFGPKNKKCSINLNDINVYEHPRKHSQDFINAGYPNECLEPKEQYNDMNELQSRIYGDPGPELGEIFYIKSTNTAYKVVLGRNGDFIPDKWNVGYNHNKTHRNWPNNEYNRKHNYSMSIVQYDKNCVDVDEKTKLNFHLKWGNLKGGDDSTLSFYGYAQKGGQLSPTKGGSNSSLTVNSMYNCAEQCREHPECKYFTFHPGKGSGYFKGYGPASVYPSNSYPRTYHGSSFGGVAHTAASEFFNPFSQYNKQNYNGDPNLFGFFRRGKKNLKSLDAKKMGCTWVTGVDDRHDGINDDTNLWPITLMINHTSCEDWGCRGDVFIKSGSIPGLNIDILFPHWFIDNSSFDFLNELTDFPINKTTAYAKLKLIADEHPNYIRDFDNRVNEAIRFANEHSTILQNFINKLNTYKAKMIKENKTDPNFGNIPQYTRDIEIKRKTAISSKIALELLLKEQKLKKDKRIDAKNKLPGLAKEIIKSNTDLFNSIPVGPNSPFQRYNSNKQRDNNGPRLRYIIPPIINHFDDNGNLTESNIAVYRYHEINKANVNILGISCDAMMDNNDKLNNNNCKNNVNQPCNTNSVLRNTKNYKGYNNNNITWTPINRSTSNRPPEARCELFNFNVDDPTVSNNNNDFSLSGVLTDRSKYTGPKIRTRQFYDNKPHWANNNEVKSIGDRYLVTRDRVY
jgi:hypothetical protein